MKSKNPVRLLGLLQLSEYTRWRDLVLRDGKYYYWYGDLWRTDHQVSYHVIRTARLPPDFNEEE